jgi:UDP-glucose 4-epimerase
MEKLFRWSDGAYGIKYVSRVISMPPEPTVRRDRRRPCRGNTLIPLILQVANGQRDHISVYGADYPTKDGTCVRDYIHVNDLADAHMLAMEYLYSGNARDIFNLGNGNGFTVREVIDTARKVTGRDIPMEVATRRAGDPAQLVASSKKAKDILGWKPAFGQLESIISSAWKWHKAHPQGYPAQ